jgi:sialic acid synthase SpsE
MIKVIADPGSCHMGNLERAYSLTGEAKRAGCDAIKWQLFKSKDGGNVPLPYEWFPELIHFAKQCGIECFASVWDREGINLLADCECRSIKFAYSICNTLFTYSINQEEWEHIYESGDLTHHAHGTDNLYCIPLYPVPYLIDFDGLFPRFDGFSSHCLGIEQDKAAIRAGAKIIEKHFQLDDNLSTCPDGNFAIRPAKLKELCDYAHSYEGLMQ